MAISAILFLIVNGQPAKKCAYFLILSSVLAIYEMAWMAGLL